MTEKTMKKPVKVTAAKKPVAKKPTLKIVEESPATKARKKKNNDTITLVQPEIKPVKQEMIVTHAQFMPQDYPFMYPCTTIYPKNSDYTKSKYIVTQP